DLAEALLESTARIVTDESGAPLSPRRQGAGLIDAGTALASPAVVLEPLLEVRDSEIGRFTLTLEVKNLSEADLTFTPSVTVLTDDYGVSGETYYTLLSPLDITEEVTVSGSRTLTVPAGETASLRLTLLLGREARERLAVAFTHGMTKPDCVTP